MRHEVDYIATTIATVRQHDPKQSQSPWPGWANALADTVEDLRTENARLRGWPDVFVGSSGVSHSPIDSYRCENEECRSEYEVWQFRPDDYDLDESVVNCPACGQEGELFMRHFRSDGSTARIRPPADGSLRGGGEKVTASEHLRALDESMTNMSDYAASLRAMVEKATPGPWRPWVSTVLGDDGFTHDEPGDAHLIAQAPALALKLADAVEALELAWAWIRWFDSEGELPEPDAPAADVRFALARITEDSDD